MRRLNEGNIDICCAFNHRARLLCIFIFGILFPLLSKPLMAETFDTVVVYGAISVDFGLLDNTGVNSYVYFNPFYTRLRYERWYDIQDNYHFALLNPMTTNDIRCSAVASAQTKNTTSKSDATERFLAANQLLTAISAQNYGWGAKAAIAGRHGMNNGKITPAFQVVYADGGKELWFVATMTPITLIVDGNVPGSLESGDGVVHGCPT